MKTCIVIHGCDLRVTNWEQIIWGDPNNGMFGRVPLALKLWAECGVGTLLHWGTGASAKDGFSESEYTYQYAIRNAGSLEQFMGHDSYEIEAMLQPCSIFDTVSLNTKDELRSVFSIDSISRMVLVSSPTHISRCLRDATALRLSTQRNIRITAEVSDTSYAESKPEDVLIIEPPHRADRSSLRFNLLLKRVLKFREHQELAHGLYKELDQVISELEKEL